MNLPNPEILLRVQFAPDLRSDRSFRALEQHLCKPIAVHRLVSNFECRVDLCVILTRILDETRRRLLRPGALHNAHPDLPIETRIVRTQRDGVQTGPKPAVWRS